MNRLNITNKTKYLESLLGRINFVLSVDNSNTEFIKYKTIINELN